jgi:hypothetical protein
VFVNTVQLAQTFTARQTQTAKCSHKPTSVRRESRLNREKLKEVFQTLRLLIDTPEVALSDGRLA